MTRIALMHNYMDNIGGAERVALILGREFKADIFTTSLRQEHMRHIGMKGRIHSIGRVPLNAPWRQQMTHWLFRHFKPKKDYDCTLITGEWAVGSAVLNKPNIWYTHSPIREIWDLYDYTRNQRVARPYRGVFRAWAALNRRINQSDLGHIQTIVASSKNAQNRLHRYLNLDSYLIYPPVDTDQYCCGPDQGYWLSVNRLIGHKRVKMQIEAFGKMPEQKLILVGCYENSRHFSAYARDIIKSAPKNVTIRSWISDEELIQLYAGCTGHVTTAKEEDIGLTPIEAMASGKPVVAPAEGGYLETIVPDRTGVLIENINADKIVDAVRNVSGCAADFKQSCLEQSARFSTRRFKSEFEAVLKLTMASLPRRQKCPAGV